MSWLVLLVGMVAFCATVWMVGVADVAASVDRDDRFEDAK